jgi:hypothetical protein
MVRVSSLLGSAGKQTIILFRCDCGTGTDSIDTKTIEGEWSLNGMLGVPEDAVLVDSPLGQSPGS